MLFSEVEEKNALLQQIVEEFIGKHLVLFFSENGEINTCLAIPTRGLETCRGIIPSYQVN